VGLIEKTDINDLAKNEKIQKISGQKYRVSSSLFFNGVYLKENDILTIEQISPALALEAAKLLAANMKEPSKVKNIVFFDFDERNLRHYGEKDFENVITLFN
jgi:hypothetical protein